MLALLGLGTVAAFIIAVTSRRLSPLVALIAVPVLFALGGGLAPSLGPWMLEGIRKIAPIGVMLMFAILYFGVMIDAGLFDPIVSRLLRVVAGDPLKVVVATAVLALLVSLDGDGSTTYMVTVTAMLPLYRRLGLNALNLCCVTSLASGLLNLTPWGGPTARVASALSIDPGEVFVPMVPAIAVGIAVMLGLAYFFGLRERRRLGRLTLGASLPISGVRSGDACHTERGDLRRPERFWFNAALTGGLMFALIAEALPLSALFMIACAAAVVVNYPKLEDQRRCIAGHAPSVIAVVSLTFAAGAFTGILGGSGMMEAMSRASLAAIPQACGPYLAVVTAIASIPCTFFVSNDAFYFGVVPVIAEAAKTHGISTAEIARASLIGQPVHLLSPLVPSSYLLASLAGVNFGDHQRFTLKWAVLVSLVLMLAALAWSMFPISGHV